MDFQAKILHFRKYRHHTKCLPAEVYTLSTNNFNRTDHFKKKIALKHNFQSNNFSQANHDNKFTFYFIKIALSLVFGLKQFTKTQTKLFAFFLLSQILLSFFLLKTLNENELQKSVKSTVKETFVTIESLKINENIFTTRQELNLNLLTLKEMNCKDHAEFFRLILLLSGDINLNLDPTQISKTWSVLKNEDFNLFSSKYNKSPI